MVDLRRLRALRELSDRGTIAAAAEALHLTPSAVSQQIAALEREAGQPLVEPHGRRVRLTPAARILLDHAGELFAQVERLRASLDAHAAGETGTARVAGFPTALSELVAPAAEILARRAPQVRLEIAEAEAPGTFDLLTAGEADIAIGMESEHAPPPGDPRFTRVPLCRDVMDVALPAGHELGGSAPVPLAALREEPWILPPAGWQCEDVVLGACQAAGFWPVAAHRTSDWAAALRLVAAGLGVALIPRLGQTFTPPAVVLRRVTGEPPCRHVFAACRGGAEDAPVVRLVLDTLAEVASGDALRPRLAAAV